ncbi:MAG: ATPase [Alphaproteobacteria bacterium]|nr:ATPase [Alphaproteobacteria bacterium]
MPKIGDLKVSAHRDTEILMTRTFSAPRRLVWYAWTKPELVRRWLLGPDGWSSALCEIDLRVGGKYRFVTRHEKGHEMGWGGVYREIAAPERLVSTEAFDQSWYPGGCVNTLVLTEQGGRTAMALTGRYDTREARDAALASPMESGVDASFARMEKVLAEIAANPARGA